jgi:cytochrome b561
LPMAPWRLTLFNWHKWAGMTILVLSCVRLSWRLTHRPPPDIAMPAWQLLAARATHKLLYLLFFLVPLAGWAYSSAAGFPIVVYGVLPVPDLVPVDRALASIIRPWHRVLAWLMVMLALVHAAAALKHHLIDRDGLLSRMWIKLN